MLAPDIDRRILEFLPISFDQSGFAGDAVIPNYTADESRTFVHITQQVSNETTAGIVSGVEC
jgi:hypothetical protein